MGRVPDHTMHIETSCFFLFLFFGGGEGGGGRGDGGVFFGWGSNMGFVFVEGCLLENQDFFI